jgi:hypothetical protein
MEHRITDIDCETIEDLTSLIVNEQKEGWSVVAMGNIFGSEVLVMVKRDELFEHDVLPIVVDSRAELNAIIAEKIAEGGKISAIGSCAGTPLIIIKKQK